ncbi:hypothetical protein MJG53_019606 [Ovis ammon polii x Ovis aries]|uniref:Uncharacterized protein n=1 Tax=Ovis ammon polii x Ovis aries TaxID=2918886 RepID=A0ACB9U0E3_9CETA|nr:hypothetical protein MJG53_019606 [Ovis ammon polii x Ovis aries]
MASKKGTKATVSPALPPKPCPWGEREGLEKASAKPQHPQHPKQEDSVASQEARARVLHQAPNDAMKIPCAVIKIRCNQINSFKRETGSTYAGNIKKIFIGMIGLDLWLKGEKLARKLNTTQDNLCQFPHQDNKKPEKCLAGIKREKNPYSEEGSIPQPEAHPLSPSPSDNMLPLLSKVCFKMEAKTQQLPALKNERPPVSCRSEDRLESEDKLAIVLEANQPEGVSPDIKLSERKTFQSRHPGPWVRGANTDVVVVGAYSSDKLPCYRMLLPSAQIS